MLGRWKASLFSGRYYSQFWLAQLMQKVARLGMKFMTLSSSIEVCFETPSKLAMYALPKRW